MLVFEKEGNTKFINDESSLKDILLSKGWKCTNKVLSDEDEIKIALQEAEVLKAENAIKKTKKKADEVKTEEVAG